MLGLELRGPEVRVGGEPGLGLGGVELQVPAKGIGLSSVTDSSPFIKMLSK